MSEPDMVNNPPHYQSEKGLECIDAIEAALGKEGFRAFLRGTILRYIWRGPGKGAEKQDYAKAQWYLDRLIKTFDH